VDAKVVDPVLDTNPPIADYVESKNNKASLADRVNSAMNMHIEKGMLNDFISLLVEDLSHITKKTLNK
jgi:hypothetical protein